MSRTDPEDGWQRRRERHERLMSLYAQGKIGEPTLRTSLEILGFRGQALKAEINLANMTKAQKR